jgi:hypothetical protein
MKQHTLTGFEKYGKTTRRAKFLADMERIIPWAPMPLERMLRPCTPREGLHQSQIPWQRLGQRGGEGEEPDQVAGASQS